MAARLKAQWNRLRQRVSPFRLLLSVVFLFFCGVVIVFILEGLWVPKKVISNSMYPTIESGEYVFVDCRKGLEFRRETVVMLRDPSDRVGGVVAKRVIGVAGDVVTWRDGELRVNDEQRTQIHPDRAPLAGEKLQVEGMKDRRRPRRVEVGEGKVFVMGDNWGNSKDSFDYGPVRTADLLGVVRFVYWPHDRIREIH